jgi:hypothetical protein
MNEMQSLAPPRLNVYPILAARLFCPTCASLVLPSHLSAGATGSLLFGVCDRFLTQIQSGASVALYPRETLSLVSCFTEG